MNRVSEAIREARIRREGQEGRRREELWNRQDAKKEDKLLRI